jgi:hypothetical protein
LHKGCYILAWVAGGRQRAQLTVVEELDAAAIREHMPLVERLRQAAKLLS